jgi:DNA-binding NarL/FixJ family response regulator
MPVRTLVVDDHAGFRVEACSLLERLGCEVVGEADSVQGAVAAAGRLQPDLVMLDIGLPDGSGLDAVPAIAATSPGSAVILVSVRPAGDYGSRLGDTGAAGFITKADLSSETLEPLLARAVR